MGYNRIRILLVDDEEDLVDFLSHRLLKQGFTIAATNSGAEAIASVERQRFDVAIVDLKMPEMDGIEFLQRIKAIQPFLEVIMLTGHGSHDSALEAGRQDAFRYLLKPYEFDQLLEQIAEAFEARKQNMDEGFRQEMQAIIDRGGSPREILQSQERLRKKYEED